MPEATVGQRISRAKQRIRDTGAQFEMPRRASAASVSPPYRHVLYLIFNEGYTASSGDALHRVELTARGDPADPPAARAAAGRR